MSDKFPNGLYHDGEIIERGLECCLNDECHSSDGMAVYEDGLSCFSCGARHKFNDGETYEDFAETNKDTTTTPQTKTVNNNLGIFGPITDRKISKDTCRFYDVKQKRDKERVEILQHFYPYFNIDGDHIATKIRDCRTKNFGWSGTASDAVLFGQHLFPAKPNLSINVFEGELDALSGYELPSTKGFPCVSVKDGAQSAEKIFKKQLEYLEGFRQVNIIFDNDEHGYKAAKKCAKLLSYGKAKIVRLPSIPFQDNGVTKRTKDANDFLRAGLFDEFKQAYWNAETYRPDGIVTSNTLRDRLKNKYTTPSTPYPWQGIQDKTLGLRLGEMVLIAARRGSGKTAIMRELTYALLNADEENKVGAMFLEESVEESGLGMMALHANLPLHLPTAEVSETVWNDAYEGIMADGRIAFFDHVGHMSLDNVISRIRYFAIALGCKYIFVDHLGVLGGNNGPVANKASFLDEVAEKLRSLASELQVCLICAIHLNREGFVRGSDGPENYSNVVFHLSRDLENADPKIRALTSVKITKNRFYGSGTGPCGGFTGNEVTGRLEYIDQEEVDEMIGEDDE